MYTFWFSCPCLIYKIPIIINFLIRWDSAQNGVCFPTHCQGNHNVKNLQFMNVVATLIKCTKIKKSLLHMYCLLNVNGLAKFKRRPQDSAMRPLVLKVKRDDHLMLERMWVWEGMREECLLSHPKSCCKCFIIPNF